MHQRTALCGHTYERDGAPRGRRRKLCDGCRSDADAEWQSGSPERLRDRSLKANAARWGSRELASCVQCDGCLPPKRATGPRSMYCSSRCRDRASYARRRERVNAENRAATVARLASMEKTCPQCSETFSPSRSARQKFCSPRCSSAWFRGREGGCCSEMGCDRPVRAKGVCNMHYKRILRAEGRIKDKNWTPKRRAAWKARYALTRGAPDAEKFDYREIYDRDGWVCGICSEPVDPDLAWPDPLSVSLDHVIPVSRGGRHVRENAQCAHLTCNVRKLDRVDAA